MRLHPVAVTSVLLAILLVGPNPASSQSSSQTEQDVREALRGERDLRGLDVTTAGSEVTLSGELETFWSKSEAIRRTLEVDGVETVVTEIVLPEPESDEELAEEVTRAVQRYAYYTIFDYLDGRIDAGNVTLMGRVTAERDKAREIFERVAKIRGIQDVQNHIQTITPSTADDRLRNSIARRIFRTPSFERFRTQPNPPFHIIVERSVVLLVGWVQGQIEYNEMERIVRQTQGVIRVINQLQTIS
ncbi:MAG: BON domain-containing protein [Acidobacteriota bacterium]|nr:BON domain-containing protein [Acidobacteriota bacterium]